jgi:hypothetical protein
MCEICRQGSHHGFAPTRRGLLLGASAAGLLRASGAQAKQNKKLKVVGGIYRLKDGEVDMVV